jgi:RNA polymerase sigma-70 factor (ECF subfamily)
MRFFYSKKREFGKIYEEEIEKIYRFIYLKIGSQEIAQDIASETFLRAWKQFKEIKIENPRAFLYRIAKNLIVDYYRQKEKKETLSLEGLVLEEKKNNPLEIAFQNEEMENLYQALKKLKEEYQDVLIWHYLDGLTIKEIAELLDRSENAARIILFRALKSLKEALSK